MQPQQVDKAKEIIVENHPLAATPVSQVFPILTPILKCFDKKAKTDTLVDEEQRAARKTNKKQGFQLSEESQGDPYNQLGFGLVAYRDLLINFTLLFATMSLLMYPALSFYMNGNGIQNPT